MWTHISSNALNILIVFGVLIVGAVNWGMATYSAPGPLKEAAFFDVAPGASLRAVSENLERAGIVSSASVFRLGAHYTDRAQDLKFGTYEISPGATMPEVLDTITSGSGAQRYTATLVIRGQGAEMRVRETVPGESRQIEIATYDASAPVPEAFAQLRDRGVPITYRVSAAPGLTSWQIVEGLRTAEFLFGEITELPPEGTLAPDTYDVRRGSTRQDLIDRMTEAQTAALQEVWATRMDNLPILTPAEALTLASIIEKETSVPEERGLVSSVFVNRLNRGMRLQTDPTVIYGVTNGRGSLNRGLLRSELRTPTAYNTYVIAGLPPGPIANPGRAALEAAVNPDESDYLFFVADGTGGHAFAETLAEHNRNVARWREIEAGLSSPSE